MKEDVQQMYTASQRTFEAGKIRQSIKILKQIVEKYPDYLPAYCSLRRAYVEESLFEEAEDILKKAIKLNPKWHLPHLHLGWAYEKQNHLPQALAAYERAVKLKPDDFNSRAYLGYMYQALNRQQEGVKELQAAYQLNPNDVMLIYHLARGLLMLDQNVDALKLLNQVLEKNPDIDAQKIAYLYQLRGNTFFNLGQLDDARSDIQKAIEIDSTIPQFNIDLGDIYFADGQHEKAIAAYKQALNLGTDKGKALTGIGNSYSRLENWESAIDFLKQAQQAGESVCFALGVAYFELGEDNQGIEYLKQEIQSDGPRKIEAWYNLGFAYSAVGNMNSAVEAFEKFLKLSTEFSDEPEWNDWRLEAQRQIEDLTQ